MSVLLLFAKENCREKKPTDLLLTVYHFMLHISSCTVSFIFSYPQIFLSSFWCYILWCLLLHHLSGSQHSSLFSSYFPFLYIVWYSTSLHPHNLCPLMTPTISVQLQLFISFPSPFLLPFLPPYVFQGIFHSHTLSGWLHKRELS